MRGVGSGGLLGGLLFAVMMTACGHQPSAPLGPPLARLARPAPPADPGELGIFAEKAAQGDVIAIARLRAAGPPGLAALLRLWDASAGSAPAGRERLSAAIDAVAKQKDARVARLYFYTDLPAAMAAAQASGKPILSLRLLGQLDEELSCANSRFFRIALYPNREVNELLRDRFILHWSSERPAPVVRIDFGDGRTLVRTVTGNSLHYVLDGKGRVVDAIPGLFGPHAFARLVARAGLLAQEVTALDDGPRGRRLRQYHQAALNELRLTWPTALAAADLPSLPFPADVGMPQLPARVAALPPPAVVAMLSAPAKAVVELPMVLSFIPPPPVDLGAYADTLPWKQLAKAHAADCALDEPSRALMRDKQPRRFFPGSSPGSLLADSEFAELLAGFQSAMAEDTAKNTFLYHGLLHRWLLDAARTGSGADSFAALNARIYTELFRTPATDPWLGLVPPVSFSGLQDDGISRQGR